MRVVVAGGSGDVGAMVLPAVSERHTVRVFDLRPPALPGVEYVPGSVTDPEAIARGVEGQEALVYLAMGRKADWRSGPDWAASHFDASVKGLYLTLTAAADAGVTHVVYASSMSAYTDYLHRDYADETLEPDAVETYGLTKRLGEQVCRAVVAERGISVVALRLTGPTPDEKWRALPESRTRPVMTAGSDVASAFVAALEHREPGFDGFTITGDHEGAYLPHAKATRVLGWAPRARRR